MSAHESRQDDKRPDREWTCRVRPLGVDVVIRCAAALVPAVRRQLSPWTQEAAPEPVQPCVVLLGPSRQEPDRAYVLTKDGKTFFVGGTLGDLMVAFQNWLDAEVTRRVEHLIPVHAGVVSWRGRAILLPGASGAGKTTLVTGLVGCGAGYYSDELAFLDSRGRVHPYPRHLMVRHALGRQRSTPLADARSSTEPLPVSLICGLRFDGGPALRVARIASSEAILLLLGNTAHRLDPKGRVPPGLIEAAGVATSYRGTRGDAGVASDAILRLAGPAVL